MIESESLLNDGIAALLFALVVGAFGAGGASPTALGLSAQALLIGAGGLAVGGAVGALAILIAWRTNDHLIETALTAVAAYGSFLIAERLGASGVLACVACGLLMGNLGVLAPDGDRFALSAQGRQFVLAFWEFAAFVANSLVFLLIGLAMANATTRSLAALAIVIALALDAARRRSIRSRSPSGARAGPCHGPRHTSCGGADCAARWRWRSRYPCRPKHPIATTYCRRQPSPSRCDAWPTARRVLKALGLDRSAL